MLSSHLCVSYLFALRHDANGASVFFLTHVAFSFVFRMGTVLTHGGVIAEFAHNSRYQLDWRRMVFDLHDKKHDQAFQVAVWALSYLPPINDAKVRKMAADNLKSLRSNVFCEKDCDVVWTAIDQKAAPDPEPEAKGYVRPRVVWAPDPLVTATVTLRLPAIHRETCGLSNVKFRIDEYVTVPNNRVDVTIDDAVPLVDKLLNAYAGAVLDYDSVEAFRSMFRDRMEQASKLAVNACSVWGSKEQKSRLDKTKAKHAKATGDRKFGSISDAVEKDTTPYTVHYQSKTITVLRTSFGEPWNTFCAAIGESNMTIVDHRQKELKILFPDPEPQNTASKRSRSRSPKPAATHRTSRSRSRSPKKNTE